MGDFCLLICVRGPAGAVLLLLLLHALEEFRINKRLMFAQKQLSLVLDHADKEGVLEKVAYA